VEYLRVSLLSPQKDKNNIHVLGYGLQGSRILFVAHTFMPQHPSLIVTSLRSIEVLVNSTHFIASSQIPVTSKKFY